MEPIKLTDANVKTEEAIKYNGEKVFLDNTGRIFATGLRDVYFTSEKEKTEINGHSGICIDIRRSNNIVFDKEDSKLRYWLKLNPKNQFQALKFREESKNIILRGVEICNSRHVSLNLKNDPSTAQKDQLEAEKRHNILNPENKVIVHEHLPELDYGHVVIDRCWIHDGTGELAYSGYSFSPYGITKSLTVTNTNASSAFWDIWQIKRAEKAFLKNCIFRNGGIENKANQRSGLQLENSNHIKFENCVIDGGALRSIFARNIKDISFTNCVVTNYPLAMFAHDVNQSFDGCYFINLGLLRTATDAVDYNVNPKHKREFLTIIGTKTKVKFTNCFAKDVVESDAIKHGVKIDNNLPDVEYEYSEEGESFVKGFYADKGIGTIKDPSVVIDPNYNPDVIETEISGAGKNMVPQIQTVNEMKDKMMSFSEEKTVIIHEGEEIEVSSLVDAVSKSSEILFNNTASEIIFRKETKISLK